MLEWIRETQDVWQRLQNTQKPIVMYGICLLYTSDSDRKWLLFFKERKHTKPPKRKRVPEV